MPAPTLVALEAELKKRETELDALSWFQNKEAANKAVVDAKKRLEDARAVDARHQAALAQNPTFRRFEDHFPDDVTHESKRNSVFLNEERTYAARQLREMKGTPSELAVTVAHQTRMRQEKADQVKAAQTALDKAREDAVKNKRALLLAAKKTRPGLLGGVTTVVPAAFGPESQQSRKPVFDKEAVHAARKEHEAKVAAELEAVRIQKTMHAQEWDAEIEKRNNQLKEERRSPFAMLFNTQDGRIVNDGQHVESHKQDDGKRIGHLSTFDRLQQAYVAGKKTPEFSPVPHHDPAALREKQDAISVASVREKLRAPVKEWNAKNAGFLAENRTYLAEEQQKKTAALQERLSVDQRRAEEYRRNQQEQAAQAYAARDERRINIFGIEKRPKTAEEKAEFIAGRAARVAAREEKRVGFFATLSKAQRKQTMPENPKSFDADAVALNPLRKR